jgi:hypothetical protein
MLALTLLQPYFFTLRPVAMAVNESQGLCEQAVIPVADWKLTGEEMAKENAPLN